MGLAPGDEYLIPMGGYAQFGDGMPSIYGSRVRRDADAAWNAARNGIDAAWASQDETGTWVLRRWVGGAWEVITDPSRSVPGLRDVVDMAGGASRICGRTYGPSVGSPTYGAQNWPQDVQDELDVILDSQSGSAGKGADTFEDLGESSAAGTMNGAIGMLGLPLGPVDDAARSGAITDPTRLLGTTRDRLLRDASDPRLRNAVENLYRPGPKVGSGSSMDAFRYEQATGELLSPTGHGQELLDRRTQLRQLLRDPGLSAGDQALVRQLLTDIQNALNGN